MRKVRVAVIGAGFGGRVLAPAFRRAGAEVAALVTRDWRLAVGDPSIDAVAIAVPPARQPEIALAALRRGKAVFAEKPLAVSVPAARAMAAAARKRGLANAVDFELPEIPAWKKAESVLASGKLGRLRHVALSWNVETFANRRRISSWKTRARDGGGALYSFVSHSFHYLERFCGPIAAVRAHLHGAPGLPGPQDTLVSFAAECRTGAAIAATVSSHAFLGGGHRLEFYGEKGTMVLENPTDNYGKGFRLWLGLRSWGALRAVKVAGAKGRAEDGRIAPVSKLASRFLSACRLTAGQAGTGRAVSPGFREGLRVQTLLEACRRSHRLGRRVRIA